MSERDAELDALERSLRARLQGDGWSVRLERREDGRVTVHFDHVLVGPIGLTLDLNNQAWRDTLCEWLQGPEFTIVRERPAAMPHAQRVGRLRQVAAVQLWSSDELAAVGVALCEHDVLTPEETDWLRKAGPAAARRSVYERLVNERLDRNAGRTAEAAPAPSRPESSATPADVASVHAALQDALGPAGWNVGISAVEGAGARVNLDHRLSTPTDRDVLQERALEDLLDEHEIQAIAGRPHLPHESLVADLRRLAEQRRWGRVDLTELGAVLLDLDVLSPEEFAWLMWAGPPWSTEATALTSWEEVFEDEEDDEDA